MLKAYGLGSMIVGNTLGSETLSAIEGIPVLLVIDSIIKWVISAMDKFGGEDMVKSKENLQGHFFPGYMLLRPSWPG